MWIGLGCYDSESEAQKRVKHLISTTGHQQIICAKTGEWIELTDKVQPDRVTNVPVDLEGKLVKQHNKQVDKEIKEMEERRNYEEELLREKEKESDTSTMDHYIHNWYNAIKNYSSMHHYDKQHTNSKEAFEKRVKAIREQHDRQPEMESQWLSELKTRLTRRGEAKFYEMIETGAKELREVIFGSDSSSIKSSLDDRQPVEVKPAETKPVEAKPVEPKPVEVKPVKLNQWKLNQLNLNLSKLSHLKSNHLMLSQLNLNPLNLNPLNLNQLNLN